MRAVISSISILQNYKTIITYFVLIPLINVFFYVMLNNEIGSVSNINTYITTINISAIVVYLTSFNGSFVYEQNMDISFELLYKYNARFRYWLLKIAICSSLFMLIQLYAILYYIISFNFEQLYYYIILIISSLITTIILSLIFTVANWYNSNPYKYTNMIVSFIYIICGISTLYSDYPPLLKFVTYIFPFSHYISNFYSQSNETLTYDLFLICLYIIILIVVYRLKLSYVRNNNQKSIL